MQTAEGLNENGVFEGAKHGLGPILAQKDDVAIDPRHGRGMGRKSSKRQVQQALFLPQHGPALDPNDDIGVLLLQVEGVAKGELDGDQRHAKPAPELAIRG